MPPALRSFLRDPVARSRSRSWTSLALIVALAALPISAAAQDAAAASQEAAPVASPAAPLAVKEALPATVGFEADRVEFDEKSQVVTVAGNVVLRRGDQSARADTVTWDRETGQIIASGNVKLVDQDGNQLFTEKVELTDKLRAGAMEDMLLVLREGGRLAAEKGARGESEVIRLDRAAYTACDVVDAENCPKAPSWRVTADRVVYDPERKLVKFRGARLELFGVPLVPLPGLSLRSDGKATSGVLVPELAFSPSNGLELGGSYYFRLAENRDVTLTGFVFTKAPPMISAQYRALTAKGAYQVTGYVTGSRRSAPAVIDFTTPPLSERGYIFANGRYQLNKNWSITGSIRRVSDRTFLRRYDISRDDRLRSMVELERIDSASYLSVAGWETQTLRFGDPQGGVPFVLPVIDYRRRQADPLLGGTIELQLNSLAITRTKGQDTQRAFASARWDLRRITSLGQELVLTALARSDAYHSDENDKTATLIYQGNPGWEYRGVATAAADIRWPLVGQFFGGRQVLTPRAQLVASPSIRNLEVPNEDARAVDLEDSNLFSLNRFPGYDRIEDSVRFTFGFDWQFERPRWRVKSTIGQSYRLSNERTLLPDGTGLTSRTSDIVGRTEIRYRDFVKLTGRYRLDKDNFAVRRAEVDATIGNRRTYAEIGYLRLNRNIFESIEDLRDREEVRVAGRLAFARYWSVFGSGVINLTDRAEDSLNTSDGFQPLRTRFGLAYEDDCLELALTWRRAFLSAGDARKGNTFMVRFALRNLGFR